MANDGGIIATLEQWFADQLAALQNNSKNVFETAEVWKHQVSASAGGVEAFARHAPFAFTSYQSDRSAREGDRDLREILEIAVFIGVVSKHKGVARVGNSNNLGTSKIRDFVITLFDKQHPGEAFDCDEIYYMGSVEVVDSTKTHAIQMTFETSRMNTS